MMMKRIGIVLAAVIPVAVVGAFAFQRNDTDDAPVVVSPVTTTSETTAQQNETTTRDDGNQPASTMTSTPATSPSVIPATTSTYTNGIYTATGSYRAPDGMQSIDVTLTITNDVVTNASVTANATGDSRGWQNLFVSKYSSQVVGKKLSTLTLTNVSGSSLTPIGFNAAIEAIKAQAKV